MKPIELLKEMYNTYLTTEGEPQSFENFIRYNGAKRLATVCNIINSQEVSSMETKALIEWESSLETGGK